MAAPAAVAGPVAHNVDAVFEAIDVLVTTGVFARP
jgi:hypothetical protein